MSAVSREATKVLEACVRVPVRIAQAINPFGATPQRRKVALLIGVTYANNKYFKLGGPSKDVYSVRSLLIERFNYLPDDIKVLLDDPELLDEEQPTKENIEKALESFIGNEPNVNYFLLYSGHSANRREEGPQTEDDEHEEYLIPSDALKPAVEFSEPPSWEKAVIPDNVITDKYLNTMLVERMKRTQGSQLVALVDSCHSGTMLNLKHHRCNRCTGPKARVRFASRRFFIEPINSVGFVLVRSETQRDLGLPRWPSSNNQTMDLGDGVTLDLPKGKFRKQCSGFCLHLPTKGKPPIICLSACKDDQVTFEGEKGGSMTRAIVALLRSENRPTYKDLVRAAQASADETRKKYLDELEEACAKKKIKWVESRGLPKLMRHLVYDPKIRSFKNRCEEVVKERCKPQLSSMKPLYMDGRLSL